MSPGTVIGMAVPFAGQGFAVVKGQTETFAPTAFDAFLRTKPLVFAAVNHCKSQILADTHSGLMLWPGELGLWAAIELPDTIAGHDVAEQVRSSKLRGMSIAFNPEETRQVRWPTGGAERRITRATISEVSLASRPMYRWTTKFLRLVPTKHEPMADLPAPMAVTANRGSWSPASWNCGVETTSLVGADQDDHRARAEAAARDNFLRKTVLDFLAWEAGDLEEANLNDNERRKLDLAELECRCR